MLELLKRHRLLLAALGVLFLLILVLSTRLRDPLHARVVDEALQGLAYPFQVAFTKTTTAASRVFDRYLFLVRLREENDRLKTKVAALEEELNHYVHGAIQFNLLREQLKFTEEDPQPKVYAEVIGESADNFYHTLLINKGYLAGIRRNYSVVLREGVVGRVQSTSALQSTVQLIVDRRHRFPVIIERTRESGALFGSNGRSRSEPPERGLVFGLGGTLQLKRIRLLARVQPGDRIVTSGLAGIFPKGYLVGTISSVAHQRHELFQTAELKPVVEFSRIEGVFVLLREGPEAQPPLFSGP